MRTAHWLAFAISLLLAVALPAIGGAPEPLKVGFIYVGPVGDYGWISSHDQDRKVLEATVPIPEVIRITKADKF